MNNLGAKDVGGMMAETGRPGAIPRRGALGSALALLTAPLSGAQQRITGTPIVPVDELVNVFEFEDMARLVLNDSIFATIAGGDRQVFERITFRPRVLVSSAALDLTTELIGERMFAPILVGPMAAHRQFHPEAEVATVRGAGAAKAVVVVSSRSSEPVERIAANAGTTLWYQVYSERDTNAVRTQVRQAVGAGCRAIMITIGNERPAPGRSAATRPDWRIIDAIRRGLEVPVVLKGIMTREDARTAVEHGIDGIVISNGGAPGGIAPLEALPSVVQAVDAKVPILIDGGIRRGSDVIKAVALGARAILLGRPVMWGLAAYGADGVRTVVELVQNEMARQMITLGRPAIDSLDPTAITIHKTPI